MKIGVLGAGQLSRMMALSGLSMGFLFSFFDINRESAEGSAVEAIGDFYNILNQFLNAVDIVTYENEYIPIALAQTVAKIKPIYPGIQSLIKSQNRLHAKELFNALDIPTPSYQSVNSEADLQQALEVINLPMILKTTTIGNEGKGQVFVNTEKEALEAFKQFNKELIAERYIPFKRELSIIAVRDHKKNIVIYPMTENTHKDGILQYSIAPAPYLSEESQKKAVRYITLLLEHLDHVGALTLELFETEQELLANEMAPRVHNAGHWTIEGTKTSQFANHLRAISGLPLGACEPVCKSALMVNIIGKVAQNITDLLELPDTYLHLYNKASRPNRKLGHITTLDTKLSPEVLLGLLHQLELKRI